MSTPDNVSAVPVAKFSDYRSYHLPNLNQIYAKILNDNLRYLISYIYSQKDGDSTYSDPSVRVAVSLQLLLASNQLIPVQMASLIIKDMNDLRQNETYLNRWADPGLKRKIMGKEIEILRKHTEIDESISLNLADHEESADRTAFDPKDYDLQSSVSTLNVSDQCTIPGPKPEERCVVM
jgi:hypothetical protein